MSIIEFPGLAHSPPTRACDSADPLAQEQFREHRAVNSVRAVAPPAVGGKFLTVDGEKFVVRGVSYGPIGAEGSPAEYGDASLVARDFTRIAAAGFNSVRVYTVLPVWLLGAAAERGLRALVGLPWAQHVATPGPPARGDATGRKPELYDCQREGRRGRVGWGKRVGGRSSGPGGTGVTLKP